jgi:hypothetical protein
VTTPTIERPAQERLRATPAAQKPQAAEIPVKQLLRWLDDGAVHLSTASDS